MVGPVEIVAGERHTSVTPQSAESSRCLKAAAGAVARYERSKIRTSASTNLPEQSYPARGVPPPPEVGLGRLRYDQVREIGDIRFRGPSPSCCFPIRSIPLAGSANSKPDSYLPANHLSHLQ